MYKRDNTYKTPQHPTKKSGFGAFLLEIATLLLIVFAVRTFLFGLYQVPSGSMETTMLVGERFFADKLSYWFRAPRRGEIIACNAPSYVYSKNPVVKLYESYVGLPVQPTNFLHSTLGIPIGPDNWTKRIIGAPGDHVKGTVEDGKAVVYLNEQKLDEPYVNKYPLLEECTVDPKVLQQKMRLNMLAQQRYLVPKSYDPSRPLNDQPFYRIDESRVLKDSQGNIVPYPQGNPSRMTRNDGSNDFWQGDEFDVHLKDNEYWIMGDNRLGSHDCRFFGPIKKDTIHGRIILRLWSVDSSESWWIFDLLQHPIDFWSRMRWNRFFNWI